MKKNIKSATFFSIILLLFMPNKLPSIIATDTFEYLLPPPLTVHTTLEETIFRRMSIREFTDEPITDEELSTILWAAYGLRNDGGHTVAALNNISAAVIYVLKEEAAYTYNPKNHSLVFYKSGDYREIVGWQYYAPIQLGLCWKKEATTIDLAGAELGEIGQNIQFIANALDLGTVVTAQGPEPAITPLGLPPNEEGMIVMPIGHPKHPYNFSWKPSWVSLFPRIQRSSMSLSTVLENRNVSTNIGGELSKQELVQVLWASYGYSYYLDESNNKIGRLDRHRTVPSAHGYYPLQMYVLTESGIYRYFPNFYDPLYGLLRGVWTLPVVTFLLKIRTGDFRDVLSASASMPCLSSAPVNIISVLNIQKTVRWDDLSKESHIWYYEAGASVHNVLLEATAWGLSGTISPIIDQNAIRSLLRLGANYTPLLVIGIGHEI